MIQKYVDRFIAKKSNLREVFSAKHPEDYKEIVKAVVNMISEDEYEDPCPERIVCVDHGDYQGTLVFVIASGGYQPSTYFYVKIAYGSCSGCDTLEGIRDYDSDKPTTEQVDDYVKLALHVVQELKEMGGEV